MKKTTKIIGVVLGVLLVAALFTGAVAAAEKGHTYYAYVPNSELSVNENQTWYLLNDQGNMTTTYVTIKKEGTDKYYVDGLEEEGWYVYQGWTTGAKVLVKFPDIVGKVYVSKTDSTYTYPLDGNFLPKSTDYKVNVELTYPTLDDVEWELEDANGAKSKVTPTAGVFNFSNKKVGEYALVPYFKDGILVKDAPEGMEYGTPISFTLGKPDDQKIVLSAESVLEGQTFVATIHGLPGVTYTVTTTKENVTIPDQKGVTGGAEDSDEATFTMGASGVFDISLKAEKKVEETTIGVTGCDSVTIEITEGVLTAEAEYEAYTIGADIELAGTSSGKELYFYIEGINIPFTQIKKTAGGADWVSVTDEEWELTLKFDYIKATIGAPDAGTYTIYVSTQNNNDGEGKGKSDVTAGAYVAVPVALKQSFINITDAPTAVAQGEKIVIEGTANAAKSVVWYLFGTNFFEVGSKNVKDDAFKIIIDGDNTEGMAAGQYFLVVQHPMYDGKYSIAPEAIYNKNLGWTSFDGSAVADNVAKFDTGVYELGTGADANKFVYVKPAGAGEPDPKDMHTHIFSAGARQTPNAAQALCDALDSQNFDDMYAKASFIVGAPTSIINPIPAKVAQGENLKISGTTTGHAGEIVSVEFLATAFAAVPKEAVGTAAFVTVNTKVQDDGTWAIDFDTSNLNVDDYTVSVAVGSLGPSTSKITITKAGEPVPTQTTVPTGQPTTAPTTAPTQTPASPGFGILAALAGLGAVAVLLLRRQ